METQKARATAVPTGARAGRPRGGGTINAVLTRARREWLVSLLPGPQRRLFSTVGSDCWRLGWSEWNYVDRKTRRPVPTPAETPFSEVFLLFNEPEGERITALGRQVLREHGIDA